MLLASILIMCSYGLGLNGSFVFDDTTSVVGKYTLLKQGNFFDIRHINHGRVIPYFFYATIVRIFDLQVGVFHLLSLIFHIGCAVLVSRYVFFLSGRVLFSFAIASFFLFHPLQTQAVSYISQASVVIASFWYLSAVCLWMIWIRSPVFHRAWCLCLCYLSIICALISKEFSYTLVCVFFLSSWYVHRYAFRSYMGSIILVTVVFFVTRLSWYDPFSAHSLSLSVSPSITNTASFSISPVQYVMTQGYVIVRYVQLALFPWGQTIDHHVPFPHHALDMTYLLYWWVLLLLTCVMWWIRRWSRLSFFGYGWFLLTLSVESSFFPISDPMMEHRMYLPLLGIVLCIGVFLSFLMDRIYPLRRFLQIFLAFLLLCCFFLTIRRVYIWQDPERVWKEAISQSPKKGRPHFNYGGVLIERGLLKEGLSHIETSARLDTSFAPAVEQIHTLFRSQ